MTKDSAALAIHYNYNRFLSMVMSVLFFPPPEKLNSSNACSDSSYTPAIISLFVPSAVARAVRVHSVLKVCKIHKNIM